MIATNDTRQECPARNRHRAFELPARDFQDLLSTPIDVDRLLEQCMNSVSFALMMLEEFEQTSQARLAAFEAALAERDHDAIRSQAHALKGVAGILAADSLLEICTKLEATASDADWNQTHDLIQQLHHEVRRTIDDIPNIRELA